MGRKTKSAAGITASRDYLSLERGSCRKKWKGRTPVALIFPNSYGLGMSNLGFQQVYHLLNGDGAIVAERFFLPDSDGMPLSVESNRPLVDFPFIFFSVSFEQDFGNLILILELAGIPSLAEQRSSRSLIVSPAAGDGQPLVVAGGVAAFMNPEPLAPFVDLFVIGEAEPLLPPVTRRLPGWIGRNKPELLAGLAACLPGYYVPAFYQPEYGPGGEFLSIRPRAEYPDLPVRVKRLVLDSPGDTAAHSRILTPAAEFSEMFMTELGRGCSRGCRFCAAGFIYRPPRLWQVQSLVSAIEHRPENCARIGLLGMEMARADDIARIAEYLDDQDCALSFSSLRADIIGSELTELLGRSNLKSVAIAPDGGSERLRRVINKGITAEDVLAAVETLAGRNIHNLKLYYMVGLPTETEADIEEMVDLILKVRGKLLEIGRRKGKVSLLTLSINCFVPKPWTPFQFHPMDKIDNLKQKLKFLRKQLGNEANLRIKTENPEKSHFQAAVARGDRRVGLALLQMVRNGYKWRRAFELENIEPDHYTSRPRRADEPFPWEIIDHGIRREYLWTEYQRALQARTTPPCDTSQCKRCGVC